MMMVMVMVMVVVPEPFQFRTYETSQKMLTSAAETGSGEDLAGRLSGE
jgi:hypothetical protein